MKSLFNSAGAVAALLVAFTGQAFAFPDLPEPGSLALTGLGLCAAVYFLRKSRK